MPRPAYDQARKTDGGKSWPTWRSEGVVQDDNLAAIAATNDAQGSKYLGGQMDMVRTPQADQIEGQLAIRLDQAESGLL